MANGTRKRLSMVLGAIEKGYMVDTFEGGFPVVQALSAVEAADDDYYLAGEAMTASGHVVDADDMLASVPDVYRGVQVVGNQASVTGNLVLTGKDHAGRTQTETLELDGTTPVFSNRPFASLDKIAIPALDTAGDEVTVGTSDRLGLYRPLADNDSANYVMTERAAAAASGFSIDAAPTVRTGSDFATVEPDSGVTADDSFKMHYLVDVF